MVIERAFTSLTRIAVLASRVICLIVIVWFAMFAVGQSGEASNHQQNEVVAASSNLQPVHPSKSKPSRWQHAVEVAAEAVTQPFAGMTSSSSNAWLIHGVDTLMALLIYGFGVGFVARMIRIRV